MSLTPAQVFRAVSRVVIVSLSKQMLVSSLVTDMLYIKQGAEIVALLLVKLGAELVVKVKENL